MSCQNEFQFKEIFLSSQKEVAAVPVAESAGIAKKADSAKNVRAQRFLAATSSVVVAG
jgi:hypothetical protein